MHQMENSDTKDDFADAPVIDDVGGRRRFTAVAATPVIHGLAEGPIWDAVAGRVMWVDIVAGQVFSGELRPDRSIEIVDHTSFDGTVGAVAIDMDGDWIVAAGEHLLIRRQEGDIELGPRIIPLGGRRRLNDGKVDPAGRFVVGTLHLDSDDSTSETLSIVDRDGSVRDIDTDLTLSNGLGWTADGSRMYSVDTLRRRIFVRDYDAETGSVGPRSTFVQLGSGYPDGLTLDADDHVWVAIWGAGEVHRYSPTGELVTVIDVPAPHTSSVAFAGALLDTLVITTATQGLDEDTLAAFPDSGRVFTATPGPLGAPQPHWGGFSRPASPIDSRGTP